MLATSQGGSRVAEEPIRLELAASLPTLEASPMAGLPTPLPSPGVPPSARIRKWSTQDMAAVDSGLVTISLSLPTPLPSPGVPTSATYRGWSDKPPRTEFCKDEPLCCLLPTPLASPGVPGSAVTRKWAEFLQQPSLLRGDSSDSTASGDTMVSTVSFPWETSGVSTAQSVAKSSDEIRQNASADSLQLFNGFTQLLDATGCSKPFTESRGEPDKEQGPRTPRWPNLTADVTNRQTTAEPYPSEKVSTPTMTLRKWKDMVVVHNSLIDAKMLPPNPSDYKCRSSSLSKDAGSSNTGDFNTPSSNLNASEQQCNSERWNSSIDRHSTGDAAISPAEDGNDVELDPCFSFELGRDNPAFQLEVDSFSKMDMVSPAVSFGMQPISLSAQAGRLGLTIQNTFVQTASLPLTPSSNTEKRSSSTPPIVYRAAARTPPTSGCNAIALATGEEAVEVTNHVTTTHAISDDAVATKADADGPQSPQPRRIVRSAKLLELMPPCCRTFFHTATAPESVLRAA